MKQIFAIIALALSIALIANAQPGKLPVADSYSILAGEHIPVIYAGSGTVKGSSGAMTNSWLQVGYSENASDAANSNLGRYNPEKFTIGLKLACNGSGDSARITKARFELAYDTTISTYWNGDSSNIFIKSGAFSLSDYGVWRFEVLSDTSRRWLYPLKVLQGGYLRFVFETTTADTASLVWTLTGEH